MRKTWKSILATALVVSVIGGTFTGCGKKEETTPKDDTVVSTETETTETETPEVDPYAEPMEISIAAWGIDENFKDPANDKLYQFLSEKFNVTIKPVNTTWDDYTQKIQTWATSGSLPDIIATDAIGTQSYRNWTTQDVVRPLLDLDTTKYPNLANYFETPDISALKDTNGKFFCVPRRMYPTLDWSALDRVVAYRWDLAQEAGITKEPETWEEFEAMLQAIVDNDPRQQNVTGLSTTNTKLIGGLFWLYSNPVATSDGSGSDYKWIKEDGQYIPAIFSKNSLAAVENMRKMYDDGIIDPDIALANLNTGYDKLVSGNVAALLMGGGYVNVDGALYAQRWEKLNPDKKFTDCIKVMKPLKGANGEYNHAIFKTYWSESYFSANVDDAKMDRIMRLYDYLLSEEGARLMEFGIEGEDYKLEGDKVVKLNDETNKYPSQGFFKMLVAYNNDNAYSLDSTLLVDEDIRKEAVDYVDWILANTKVPEFAPELTYVSTPTKDTFTVLDHDDLLNIMMGSKPVEEMWNDTIASYKAKGLDKMIEEVNAKASEMGLQ